MTQSTGRERAAALSFRQLKLFEAIGDLQSVRRASEECSLSQPAVTQALAKLEDQVGAVLVDRRASGSYLNDMGGTFHARVRRFFAQMEQAVVELGAAATAASAKPIVNRITRSQVRTLIASIENGGFECAAGALGISPASLQRAARDLEGNLRKSLYYRSAAGMLVSPLGADFGRKMKLALQEIEWGIEELDAARGGATRPIVIGAMPFGGSVLLASVLDDFLRQHPRADVRIVTGGASEITRKLRAGDVDFVLGLVADDAPDGLSSEALAQTPYSVVVRRGHPLTRKGRVTADDLCEHDWVVGTPGSGRRASFERMFAGREGPQTSIATCAMPVLRQLLARSERLTLMTSFELLHETDDLRALPYGPILPIPSIGVTTRAGWLATPLHGDLLRIVRASLTRPLELREAG